MAEKQYQRLTRWRRRRFLMLSPAGRSSLWLAGDHLLNIDSSYFTEEYKRFYFRDIQAITIRTTSHREVMNLVFGLLTIAALAVAVRAYSGRVDTAFGWSAVPLLLTTFGLIVNNSLGASCVVHIRTAVQTEQLPSLRRFPQTRRVLGRIRPRIVAAQGVLPEEEIAVRIRELTTT